MRFGDDWFSQISSATPIKQSESKGALRKLPGDRVAPDTADILAAFPRDSSPGPHTGGGKMVQISPQDAFNTLLSFLKSKPLNWLIAALHVPALAEDEGRNKFMMLQPTAVKIMESGIFLEGGLKGQAGDRPYPIPDLAQFIYALSYRLFVHEMNEYPEEFQSQLFSKGIYHLKLFTSGVRSFKGRRAAQRFKTMLDNLDAIEKEIQAKTCKPRKVSIPKLKREIADIFCDHIKAPKYIIADLAAALLKEFDISATPEGVRDSLKER
jgi:hypothetical protein